MKQKKIQRKGHDDDSDPEGKDESTVEDEDPHSCPSSSPLPAQSALSNQRPEHSMTYAQPGIDYDNEDEDIDVVSDDSDDELLSNRMSSVHH